MSRRFDRNPAEPAPRTFAEVGQVQGRRHDQPRHRAAQVAGPADRRHQTENDDQDHVGNDVGLPRRDHVRRQVTAVQVDPRGHRSQQPADGAGGPDQVGGRCEHQCHRPANLFVPTSDGGILFNYEECFECGTCYMVCNTAGAITWRYPEGGRGVVFRRS